MFLMALLNAINGKNRWPLYEATLLFLLLAIDKRPTQFVIMAWNHQRDLASQFFSNAVVEDKTIGWYCHNTGQHQLGFSICCAPPQLLLCWAYTEWAVVRALRRRASALFVHQVHFRAHRSLLPIAQSQIRLIVVRSSSPSLTMHLSCGAWAPAHSGGDHWHNRLHIPLSSVWTWWFCCCFCNQQCWLSCGTTQRYFLPWQHKGLWPTHLLQWQLQRDQFHCRHYGASLWWCRNRCNWFYCEHFGTFTIVEGCGPVTHCGKGLVVALHGIRGPKALCGERLIIVLHDVHSQLALWWGACCCTQPSHHSWQGVCCRLLWWKAPCGPHWWMHPPWQSRCTRPWCCTCCLWHTCCTHLRQRTCLFQGTCQTQPLHIPAAGRSVEQYGHCCILQMTTYYIWLLRGSRTLSSLAFVCYCHHSLRYDNKKWLSHCQCSHRGVSINLIAGALHLCDHQCGWSTSMKRVGCCLCNIARLSRSTKVAVFVASCDTT